MPNPILKTARSWLAAAALLLLTASHAASTRNVVLITLDGLRWQEVFRGIDAAFVNPAAGGVAENAQPAVLADFGAPTPAERRQKLMPFLWSVIARDGQILGNRDRGSVVAVTNPFHVSYPGYNEILTGRPDPQISSNARVPNPNVSVLEWLAAKPAFTGRVVACTTWQAFPAIYHHTRSGLPQWVSGQKSPPGSVTPGLAEIERWMEDIPSKAHDEHYDAFAYRAALEYIETVQPRILHLALGEPDTWAHGRHYDSYLASIRNCDRFIRNIWEKLQSMPAYRGTTTLLLSPDHGRGHTGEDWIGHSAKIPHTEETWLAAMGPDTPPLGECGADGRATQGQLAATIAALLGENFREQYPEAAAPIATFLAPAK